MKSNVSTYRQIFDLSKRSPFLLAGLVVASLLAILCEGLGIGLILPILGDSPFEINALAKIPFLESLHQFISELELTGRIRLAAFVLVSIVFMRSVFSYVSQVFTVHLQVNTETDLQKKIFSQILAVQISLIHQEQQGNLVETLFRHTRQVGALILALANGLIHCFTIIIYVALALLVSWQLTLIATVLFFILLKLINLGFSARIRWLSNKQKASGLQFMSTMTEQLSALHLTHLFAREKHSLGCFMAAQQKHYAYNIRTSKLVSLTGSSSNFFSAFALGLLLVASTFLIKDQSGGGWIGQITLFLIIAFRLMVPATALNRVMAQMDDLSPYLQSVIDFIRREDKPYLKDGTTHFERLETEIAFKNVTFKYHADENKILTDVSIDIPKGKMTAVVGPSGAGKSTLVNLVTRLYDPEDGSILIDGTNLCEFDITS